MTPARRRDLAITAAVLLASACGGAGSDDVRISEAWARPTPAGATVAAVYFRLETGDDDRLVAATVDKSIAGQVELHATLTDDSTGAARMDPLNGVAVDGGEPVTFEPGGNHAMLVDLPVPLAAGATFDVTLQLERAGPQVVEVTVREEAP
ncbi:MAG: copper chaperone PCu(A)C [Ilumatobacteraceae bacterium]